ncbi:hypothetical protein [Actinophytocola sp. NPDC049390]|uniref:hypothetical protein n=1 Tax=Actinophytocola sp. NPDC049390 TaxID=3363894 RepID=UPI003797D462
MLERLLADSKQQLRPEQRLPARFELLRVATQLGAAGHPVVAGVVTAHPENMAVRALGAGAVKRAAPTDQLIESVARAVLRGEPHDHERYYYELMLERLEAGLTADNVASRVRLVAAKVREVAEHPEAGWVALDIARLTTDLGEDDRDYLVVVTHYLARIAARARQLGVPSAQVLDWTKNIPGEIGERITCRILAEAGDIPVHDKVDHITRRIASSTATGDDKDLIDAILATEPDPPSLTAWTDALGSPTPAPSDANAPLPPDWPRAWRWSMVLPEQVLTRWQEPITQVTGHYGAPSPKAFDHRTSEPTILISQSRAQRRRTGGAAGAESRSTGDELAPRCGERTADAERSGTRQGPPGRRGGGPAKVGSRPERCRGHAARAGLCTPLLPCTHQQGQRDHPSDTSDHRRRRACPSPAVDTDHPGLGRLRLRTRLAARRHATVDLVAALANHDGPLAEDLDTVWTWALALLDLAPTTNGSFSDGFDALNRAINTASGRSLQAVLALGGWEYRHQSQRRPC